MKVRDILCYFFLLTSFNSFAQETTSTISGFVTDNNGTPVGNASVLAKHEPTGYVTGTQTNSKGFFVMPNLKPGGPYTISISFVGFKEEKNENVNLALGNNPDLNIALRS